MYNIALLSNTNVDPITNRLAIDNNVYKPSGYGNVFEELLNSSSNLNLFNPDVVFIIIDLSELIINCNNELDITNEINDWFDNFLNCNNSKINYFISDVDIRDRIIGINIENHPFSHYETIWNKRLEEMIVNNHNVYLFPYKQCVENIGKNDFYSSKLWLLGRIAISEEGRKIIIKEIQYCLNLLSVRTKKVLVLDLDNTLWGGLAGENDNNPIKLSSEHIGLVYKNFQKAIKRIKSTGVLLAIVSKNNEEETIEVIKTNPHMILKLDDFIALKINWSQKNFNIAEIAKELNLGLDSFVFIDDNPTERELVKTLLPEVEVPDFPEKVEQLPEFAAEVYNQYFKKLIFSKEDNIKTELYKANMQRNELSQNAVDFTSYLKNLNIKARKVSPVENSERLYQLLNKTNQFNLTTQRYDYTEINELLESDSDLVYLFEVSDKFGNNGITAVVIVKIADTPCIASFVLSCRIMGKYIENYILDCIEQDMKRRGYHLLEANYKKTSKNIPVENFYENLGYELIFNDTLHKKYQVKLNQIHKREFYVDSEFDEEDPK